MESYEIEKLKNVFGHDLSFHDGEVCYLKFNKDIVIIKIDCKNYLRTKSLVQEEHKIYKISMLPFSLKMLVYWNLNTLI